MNYRGIKGALRERPSKNINILPSTKPYQHLVGDEQVSPSCIE